MRRTRPHRRSLRAGLLVALLVVLASCDGETSDPFSVSVAPTTSSAPPVTQAPSEAPSPTPPSLPASPPPTAGTATATCVGGWVTPEPGSKDFERTVGKIRRAAPFSGPAEVVEMRLFIGPESPPSDKNYLKEIRRWYVKLFADDDLTYQGRFIVEERRFGVGVVAVAPYDTAGFEARDWIGFQWDGGDIRARPYEGLPGRWKGTPYDFVSGGEGLTIPGLPDQVVGCLDGT